MIKDNHFENLHFIRSVNTIASIPPSYPLHWHKYIEILALPQDNAIQKPAIIQIHQTTYQLHAGDLIMIWPGELHEIIENSSNRLFGIQFTPTVFNELSDFAPYTNHFRNFHLISHFENVTLSETLLTYVQHILELQDTNETFHNVESYICLLEFFMYFGKYIDQTSLNDVSLKITNKNQTIKKINQACTYISENCEQEISLEKTAELFGFSSCYFSRAFKKTTDYNFVEYLMLQRVKRAQTLLTDDDIAITEIAYLSGFKSISTFNRVFKQLRGCSPSEYRKYYAK